MFQERTIQESCCKPAMKSCLQWTSYKNLLQERGVHNVVQKSLQDTFNTCVQKRDPNFEAFDCGPLPWLLSSQMRRSWPATEILPQTPHVDQVRWTLRSLQPIQLMRCPAMDVSGVPWTLALACATYGPQRWWGSTAPKVHQDCQELRSSWFPQNLNSSIVCGLSFPSISHLQTVALLDIAS